MEAIQVRPLGETDLDYALEAASGERAHPDADRRSDIGADYQLGRALIELKALDEEGLFKPTRQEKLAALFTEYEPNRPVIVIDRSRLQADDQRRFDRIIEGPIKNAVTKANKQLKQSRSEFPDADCSVLFVINNGYTTLSHDALKDLVAHRVRQDTSEIDAVVVAGAYFHSDGMDSFFLWPIDYVPINLSKPFAEFEQLRSGWNRLAERFMSDFMTGKLGPNPTKGPVVDTQFDIGGITFVRPAPAIGGQSKFYVHGRPRKNSTGLEKCPLVGTTFPSLTRPEWSRFSDALGDFWTLKESYADWKKHEQEAREESDDPLKPFVTIPVSFDAWKAWCAEGDRHQSALSIFQFANDLFSKQVNELIGRARDREASAVAPSRYVLALTDIIGQDKANDVSEIVLVRERSDGNAVGKSLAGEVRIFHEHALALACAYAVREGIDTVMWMKDSTYAWV